MKKSTIEKIILHKRMRSIFINVRIIFITICSHNKNVTDHSSLEILFYSCIAAKSCPFNKHKSITASTNKHSSISNWFARLRVITIFKSEH